MKPWSKLWRKESAKFRSLPLQARMLAAYVLKFVDEHGSLPMGHRDPVTAIAIAIGAAPCDRRWLRPAVHSLLEHGYLCNTEGSLTVPNYPKYQDVRSTRDEREADAKPTRDEREISVSVRKDALAQNVLLENKKDTDTDTDGRAHFVRANVTVVESDPDDPQTVIAAPVTTKGRPVVSADFVMLAFEKAWLKYAHRIENVRGRGHKTREKAQAIADLAVLEYPEDPQEAIRVSAAGFAVLHKRSLPKFPFDVWAAMKRMDEWFVSPEEAARA